MNGLRQKYEIHFTSLGIIDKKDVSLIQYEILEFSYIELTKENIIKELKGKGYASPSIDHIVRLTNV